MSASHSPFRSKPRRRLKPRPAVAPGSQSPALKVLTPSAERLKLKARLSGTVDWCTHDGTKHTLDQRHFACHSVLPGGDNRWAATICNVSNDGLNLVACRPFNKGDVIAVELVRQPVDGLREKVFARVRHSVSQDGVWIAGCRLVNRLSDEELERLCSNKRRFS